jgi:hypothetical protein
VQILDGLCAVTKKINAVRELLYRLDALRAVTQIHQRCGCTLRCNKNKLMLQESCCIYWIQPAVRELQQILDTLHQLPKYISAVEAGICKTGFVGKKVKNRETTFQKYKLRLLHLATPATLGKTPDQGWSSSFWSMCLNQIPCLLFFIGSTVPKSISCYCTFKILYRVYTRKLRFRR